MTRATAPVRPAGFAAGFATLDREVDGVELPVTG